MEEIGYEVGLDNPAYFSRVFKKVEGVSPKTYREQW
ncbi:helix-turn-helix domain-containing protein [[Clostridium] aminophilum]